MDRNPTANLEACYFRSIATMREESNGGFARQK
jgi:hypothetical protein